ncbi:hypothetical protein PR003_g30780 [Phytophthora rubi]|uniref:Myb-like domain-containing protein n=1 Tax=Phytophthora rubi TaxID=129364 RepID=A0A6A3GWW9_9STRA|nr:hypothetical protein PR001_g30011 [Phytophthora rubi]KAE8964369.1 hypothetical protein PR002_g28996 [Phytophthora rubi]KAE9270554.1 hypothetical protein PR003_g30780 [Phytophthora rubi]
MISPEVMKELLSVRQVLHYLPASLSTDKGWTVEESQLFWMALIQYPQGPWTTIAEFIGTKSTRQAMTHGQKLRQKLKRWNKRLRRNPAMGLLMDEISVSPDGRISLGSSPLSDHPVLRKTAIHHPLHTREVRSPKTQSLPDVVVKREELRVDSVGFAPDNSGLTSVLTPTCTVPPDAAHLKISEGWPLLYPSLNGSRPHLPVAGKLMPDLSFASAGAQLSLVEEDVFDEFTRQLYS